MHSDLLRRLGVARAEAKPAALLTDLDSGAQWLMIDGEIDNSGDSTAGALQGPDPDSAAQAAAREMLSADRSGRLPQQPSLFVATFNPPLRLAVVGAVHIAQALLPLARQLGYAVSLIDPRSAWASSARFSDVETDILTDWPDQALNTMRLDRRSALITLSHDPKLDDPALIVALRSEAFYIGCLGSKKTHAARLQRLREAGFSDTELARLHAPLGLDLGGRSPAEIALAAMAELTQVRHQRHA